MINRAGSKGATKDSDAARVTKMATGRGSTPNNPAEDTATGSIVRAAAALDMGCVSRMVRMASAAPAPDGMGIVNYMTSYADHANFGYSACQEMIPDPDHYTDCIRESFQTLCERSGVRKPGHR